MNGTGIEARIGAETVPPVGDIPTEPKAFERWLTEQGWHKWPTSMWRLAYWAKLSMAAADQRAWEECYALRKAAKADWNAFLTAYAAYRAEVA